MGSDTDEEGKTQQGAREARIRGCLSLRPPSWSPGPSPHTASQGAPQQGQTNPNPNPSFQSPLVKKPDSPGGLLGPRAWAWATHSAASLPFLSRA